MFTPRKGALCPQCEKGKLLVESKDWSFAYKNRSKKFPNQKTFVCNVCDYECLTSADYERIEKILADFRRSIEDLLSCEVLQSIRESLGLNKKLMAKLLSVNEKTIGRYENGKVTQSAQVDKLYRVLLASPSFAKIIEPNINVQSLRFHNRTETTETSDYSPEPANGYYFDTSNLEQRAV